MACDQLLAIERGGCDIEAIATIGTAPDAARRIAARRDIPYVALGCTGGLSIDLFETEWAGAPLFDVDSYQQLYCYVRVD